jgi:hypothetical protein
VLRSLIMLSMVPGTPSSSASDSVLVTEEERLELHVATSHCGGFLDHNHVARCPW